MIIAIDESGNTGEHLLDREQLVFTLASTSISDDDARQLLSVFAGRIQGEYKYAKLKKARRNHHLILDTLAHDSISSETCKAYVIHKPFMAVSKLVDNVYEPLYREGGVDIYEKRGALATANLISGVFPAVLGQTRYLRFLGLFSNLCRVKTIDAFERYRKEAEGIYSHLKRRHPFAADVFVPIMAACSRGLTYFEENVPDLDHDPIIPSYYVMLHEWSRVLRSHFTVLADESKTLATSRELLLKLSDPTLKPTKISYYGLNYEFPLLIDDINCADSKGYPSLQLADFLAGAVCQAFNTKVIAGTLCGFDQELMDILVQKKLFIGGIWPSPKDVTPESLDATGDYHGSPADITTSLLDNI